jgi:hypothetical protein
MIRMDETKVTKTIFESKSEGGEEKWENPDRDG